MVEVADPLLNEHPAVAELPLGIVLDLAIDAAKMLDLVDLFDPHAAAAGRRLDQN